MALPLFAFLAAAAMPAPDVVVVAPVPHAFAGPVVPDKVLAAMRGGFRLPNGLDLALGIDIQTRIDGLLAVHTVYASEGSQTGIRVFTDGLNPVQTAPATRTIETDPVPSLPVLVVDRSPTGTTVVPTSGTPGTTVNLVHGDPSTWLSGAGQQQVAVTPNGPAVSVPYGAVSLTADQSGAVVTLQAPDLEVRQLIGQATGVVIANTGSNRVIDTVSAVNVDLVGLNPALLSSSFLAERAAMDAVIAR